MVRAVIASTLVGLMVAVVGCGGDDTLIAPSDGGAQTDAPLGGGIRVDISTLDFGREDCGGDASVSKAVHLTNDGTAVVHWSVALSGSSLFSVAPPSSESTLAPGASVDIVVNAAPMPSAEAWGTVESASLSIFTDDPAHFQTLVSLKTVASGAALSVSNPSLDFGEVPLNTTSNALTDVITNSGDEPVTLAIDATNAAFALKWPVSPDAIALDPKGAFTLSSTFHPTAASSASTSFPLTVASGHVCGGVPSIAAHGRGTSGAIGIQPGSIDFGYVDCGTTSTLAVADRTVTITNTGNVPMTWQASLRRGVHSFYDLTTSNTTIGPGASGTIVVTSHAIPSTSSTMLDYFGDGIVVTTDIPADLPHLVELHETAHGAILTVPPSTDFPHGSVGKKQTAPIRVRNVGNAAIDVDALLTGDAFALEGNTAIGLLAPAQSALRTVSFTPSNSTDASGSFAPTVFTGVLCAPLPSSTLTGKVDEPDVVASVASIDLGSVACGVAPAPTGYTIQNNTPAPVDFEEALVQELKVNPLAGTLSASETQAISVTPNSDSTDGAGGHGNYLLDVWSSGTSIEEYPIPISIELRGAQLDVSKDADFGVVPIGLESRIPIVVSNSGTAPGAIQPFATGSGFAFDPPPGTLLPGDSALVFVRYTPATTTLTSIDASTEPPTGTVVCPIVLQSSSFEKVHVAVTGNSNGVVVSPSYVDLGRAPCGSPTQPVGVANRGSTAFWWEASVGGSHLAGGTLSPNASTTFVVGPGARLSSPDPLRGTIEVRTDVPGDGTHEVTVLYNSPATLPPACP